MYNQNDKHFLLTNIYHLNIYIINKNKFSIDILGYTTFEQIEKTIKLLYTGNYNMNIYIINNNVNFNYEIINNKKQKINRNDYKKYIIDVIDDINNNVIDIEVQVNMEFNNNNNENFVKNNEKKFKNLSVYNFNFFYYNNYKTNFNNNNNNSFYNNNSNIKNNINNNNISNNNNNNNINNNNINNINNNNINNINNISNINNNNSNLNSSSKFINSFYDNTNSSNKKFNTFSDDEKINFNTENLNFSEKKEKNDYLKLNSDFSKMVINDILKEDLIALCESVKHSKSTTNSIEKKILKTNKKKWEESSKLLKKEIILKGAKKIKRLISIINEFCNLIDFYIEIHNESLENIKKNITNIDNNTIINNNFLRRSNKHFNEQLYKIREKYFKIVSFWNNFYENLNRFFNKKNNLNVIFDIKYNLNKNRINEIDDNFIENNINDFQSKREIILKSKQKINYNFVDFIGYPIKKTNEIYYYHKGKFFKSEINFPFNNNKNSIINSNIKNNIFYDKLSYCNYDNYLYISGGIYYENIENTLKETISNKVFIINLKTKEMNFLPSLKFNRHSHSSIFYNNNLFIIGGSNCLKNEVLNIFKNEWKLLPDLKSERKFPILFVGNNKLYVFGGIDSNNIIKLSYLILDLNFDNNWIENECKIYENNKIIDSLFLFGSGVFRFVFNEEDALYFLGGFTKSKNNNKKKENLIVYNNNIYKFKFDNKFYKLKKQTENIFFEENNLKFFFSEDIFRCDESIFFGIGIKKNNEIMPFCIDPIEYLN